MKEELIHVTLIARAADGIWYVCAELFAKGRYKIELVSSMVVPLLAVNDLLKRLYSPQIDPEVSLN